VVVAASTVVAAGGDAGRRSRPATRPT